MAPYSFTIMHPKALLQLHKTPVLLPSPAQTRAPPPGGSSFVAQIRGHNPRPMHVWDAGRASTPTYMCIPIYIWNHEKFRSNYFGPH